MAQTNALTQLQEQIEAIRKEAFSAGYQAAMASIREFAAQPNPAADGSPAQSSSRQSASRQTASRQRRQTHSRSRAGQARTGRRERAAEQSREPARSSARRSPASGRAQRGTAGDGAARPQRGNNARLIEEVLREIGRPARPTEIRNALQRDKNAAMAFTSIRHALGQLEGRGVVEQVADTRTWRLTSGGGSGS